MEEIEPTAELLEARCLVATAREARIRKQELALALDIDRSTLWKYEQWPHTAPEGFWSSYAVVLRTITDRRREGVLAAVGTAEVAAR